MGLSCKQRNSRIKGRFSICHGTTQHDWRAAFPRCPKFGNRGSGSLQIKSLDGHALGEVARFVHVAAEVEGSVVGEELEGDGGENGAEVVGTGGGGGEGGGGFFLVSGN